MSRAKSERHFFRKHERETIDALAREVLPAAYNGHGKDFDVTAWIEKEVGVGPGNELFHEGLAWLDEVSQKIFGMTFSKLARPRQHVIIQAISGKNEKKIDDIEDPSDTGKIFFQKFRYHAYRGFYSTQKGWDVVGYSGPPQRYAPTKPLNILGHNETRYPNYDVCVVGSGAGGAVVAHELSKAGIRVLLIESGKVFQRPRDFIATNAKWEIERSPLLGSSAGYPFSGGPRQKLDDRFKHLVPDYTDTTEPDLKIRKIENKFRLGQRLQMAFGVGGTTLVYEAQCTRYGNETFREHTLDGVGADWPLSYEDIKEDYDAIEDILGVSGDPAMPGPPRSKAFPNPPHRFGKAALLLKHAANKLNLRVYSQALATPSLPYRGRPACKRCGCCMLGCAYGAKGSTDICFIQPALRTGRMELRTGCRCLRLDTNQDGSVSGVIFLDEAGVRHVARTRLVVLAAGAIETPRILLSSSAGKWKRGAANDSGQVGRNYQETLVATSYGLVNEPLTPIEGPAIDNVIMDFAATRRNENYARGFTLSASVAGMNLLGPLSYALQIAPGWGIPHENFMRERFGQAFILHAAGEQLPSSSNRVVLDPARKDCRGEHVVKVLNWLGENDLLMLNAMFKRMNEVLSAAGAFEIKHANSSYVARMGVEPRGTCRMGDDPEHSVVNSHCMAHEVNNLYIVDASVLVGGMHGNIALTIQALACRAAKDIKRRMLGKEI